MRKCWSSSAAFFSCVQLYLLDAVLGMKTHSDFEGGSVSMVMQSAPLYGQSFKKKRNIEFW